MDQQNNDTDGCICKICYERPKSVVFFPCKYFYVCDICYEMLRIRAQFCQPSLQPTCPQCRRPIERTIIINPY